MDFSVRQATADDCSELAAFLQRLVSLRNEPGLRTQNAKDLHRDGFARKKPKFAAFLAETCGQDKEVIGFALFSYRYHSFVGRGLHLNNLFVLEPHRGKGVATQLLKRLIKEGLRQGCHNMGFMSNSWNHIAKNLYKKMGAINLTETYGLHAYEYVTQRKDITGFCKRHSCQPDSAIIRKATIEDLSEITRLLKSYKETQNVCMMDDIEENVLRTNGFEDSPKFFAYVAEKPSVKPESEKRLVGILTYSYAYCSHSSTTISLDAIFVEESYRREGLACALFHTCRQDEALKNHIKIRFFVDSSIDSSHDFFRHVDGIDQSERAQWIWSIVPHEDLSNYALEDSFDSESNVPTSESSENQICNGIANDVTLNGTLSDKSALALKDITTGISAIKCSANGNASLKTVTNGDASLKTLANGEASLKSLTNGGGKLTYVTNGDVCVANGDVPVTSNLTNGFAADGVAVNGETSNV